jgi:tripartite-type tricarboxylate transporter receptor subunit TctC
MKKFAVALAGAVALLLAHSPAAVAQEPTLPQGPVTILVPFAAGGPADSVARMLAEHLAARLKRNFIVENKGGAGGNLAAAQVAKAAPDGRTLLFAVDSIFTVNPHAYKNQGFGAGDIVPLAQVGEVVLLLAVNARKVAAKDFAELVLESKSRPLSFGSAGVGSPGHLAFEYLRQVSAINGVHVPYRGAALALQDMLAGTIDASFIVSGVLVPHVQAGTLRALAVSGNRRVEELPDVPTAQDAGIKGFEARFVNFLMAPAKIDPAIAALYEREVLAMKEDVAFAKRLQALSTQPVFATGAQAQTFIADARERWGKVVSASGMVKR